MRESSRLPRVDTFAGYLVLVYFGLGGASRSPFAPIEVPHGDQRQIHRDRAPTSAARCSRQLVGNLRDRSDLPEGIIVYKILDALTDSFFAALDAVDDKIEDLEGAVLDRPHRAQLQKLVELKNRLVPMRKIATRQRNVLARAEDEIAGLPGLDAGPHDFRDIYQRMVSVSELIDSSRDVLTGAQDVYLSSVTERLTLVATVFFPLTVLTGFFGMNFGWMVQHIDSFTAFADPRGRGHAGPDSRPSSGLFLRAGYIGPRQARLPLRDINPGDDWFRRGRFVEEVASRGPRSAS